MGLQNFDLSRQPNYIVEPKYKLYVIYNKTTSDYPGKYVVRIFTYQGPEETPLIVCDTLQEARGALPTQLYNIGRKESDDPVIEEVWI